MSGKRLLIVFFALLVAALGFIFWNGMTGGGTANRPSEAGSPASADTGSSKASRVIDARAREELRQRILAGWAAEDAGTDEQTRTAARAGRFIARPDTDGRGIDRDYVDRIMREDLRPMVRQCYENLLAKRPDAGGRVEIELTVVGDDELGGIVDQAGIADASTLSDPDLDTCIRESAMTLAFPPPAHDGVVTLHVPITFAARVGSDR